MKQGRFLGDALFVQLINFLVKPAWLLLIDRSVQNRLPAEDYGNYFSLFAFSLIFSVLLDPGLNTFQSARFSKYPEKISTGLPAGILLKLFLSLLFFLVLLIGAVLLKLHAESLLWLCWIAVNQILLSWILYFRSFFTAMHLFRIDALLSAGDKLLAGVLISPVLFLGFGPELNLSLFLGVQTIALALVLIIAGALLRKRVQIQAASFSSVKALAADMFKSTWPFALLTALMLLFSRMDAIMLRMLLPLGKENAGTYALGFRLLEALNMIPALFAGMLLPVFARTSAQPGERRAMLGTAWMLMILPAVVVAVISAVFSAQWAQLIYPDHAEASGMIEWLLPAFLPFSVVYVYGTLLTADHALRNLNILAGITLSINFILNLLLIPDMEAKGAAIATLITQSVFAAGCIWLAGKEHWPTLRKGKAQSVLLPVILWLVCTLLLANFCTGLISLMIALALSILLLGFTIMPYVRNILQADH